MTIEASIIAQWERDGYPVEVVKAVNAHPEKSLESIVREWVEAQKVEE